MDEKKDAAKDIKYNLQQLRKARKAVEDRQRGDGAGYTMEGLRLVTVLNQLQALQAIQGLQELTPKKSNRASRYEISRDKDERDRQRQWLTFKADWLETLLEDTVSELEAINRYEIGGSEHDIFHKRLHQRKLIELPAGYDVNTQAIVLEKRPCKVLDISEGGVKLLLNELIDRHRQIRMSLEDGQVLDGVVMWSKIIKDAASYYAGVKFNDPPDVIAEKLKKLYGK